jgi:hypothetical protein
LADTAGPISVLERKLRSRAIPSLRILVARLGQVEEYGDFVALVREYLPEREFDILGQSMPAAQLAAFANYFEERYFPLHDVFKEGDVDEYEQLTHSIPVVVMGISYDFYLEIDSYARAGIQLMTYLVQDPFQEEDGSVALAEACAQIVPAAIVDRVPPGGFPREVCHSLIDTPYKGLAHWSDQLWAETGNYFLDVCDEDTWGCGGCGRPDWDREVVDELTEQWQRAMVIDQEISSLALWLEENPRERFEELVDFMEGRMRDG